MSWKPDMTPEQRMKLNLSRRKSYAKKRLEEGKSYTPRGPIERLPDTLLEGFDAKGNEPVYTETLPELETIDMETIRKEANTDQEEFKTEHLQELYEERPKKELKQEVKTLNLKRKKPFRLGE